MEKDIRIGASSRSVSQLIKSIVNIEGVIYCAFCGAKTRDESGMYSGSYEEWLHHYCSCEGAQDLTKLIQIHEKLTNAIAHTRPLFDLMLVNKEISKLKERKADLEKRIAKERQRGE